MNKKYFGSCLCGQVTFEIEGTFDSFYLCHCKFCQKDTGSAHGANLFSTTAQLSWITGTDNVHTFNLPSTKHIKSFCKECGSALPNQQREEKLLVVPAGSLDTSITVKPAAHLFYSSRACWDDGVENIKKFENFPV
jgi:hypothetical protein